MSAGPLLEMDAMGGTCIGSVTRSPGENTQGNHNGVTKC